MLTTIFSTVLAGGANNIDLGTLNNSNFEAATTFTIPSIISTLISIVLVVAGVVFFFMLIWGGISWIMSGGDKAKTEAARNRITAALVGLIVLFSAWAIATLMYTVFGIDVLNVTLPTIQ